MLNKVRSVSSMVERALAQRPELRDSDQALILQIWEWEGLLLTPAQQTAFLKCSSSESIRRNRQKLQERGKYLGSLKVMKERQHRSLEMQQSMPSHRPTYKYDQVTNTMKEII